MIATVERNKKKNEKGDLVETEYLRLTYARIFHIDAPAANFPKDAASMKHIEAKDRRPPECIAVKAAAANHQAPPPPPTSVGYDPKARCPRWLEPWGLLSERPWRLEVARAKASTVG